MSETIRVGMLTPFGTMGPGGGVEVFNEYLRQALGNVEIFADPQPGDPSRFGDLGRVGLDQPYRALRAARALVRRHRENPFHLVISNGLWGWPPGLAKLGVPLVQVYHFTMAGLAQHALPVRSERVTTGRVAAFFDRIAGVGKHVVAVSKRVLDEVNSLYRLEGRVIANGVDTTAFRPMDRVAMRGELGLPADATIGIFVGRPDYAKGYDIVLRVARQMPEVLFLVAGRTGEPEGNVLPVGWIAHADMAQWYAASDFFFLPSRYEGCPFSTVEALSCNVPVVVSRDAFPFPEEPSTCGVVVDGSSDRACVEAIRAVLRGGDSYSPRRFVVPRYSFETFRGTWRGLVSSLAS